MRDLVRVLKTLSDESRLRVLNVLIERESCVCEVMQALDISQSKASRILGSFYDVGLLKLRKEGLWSLYSIDWDGMDGISKGIVETMERAFKDSSQMTIDRERLKNAERIGPCCAEKIRGEESAA